MLTDPADREKQSVLSGICPMGSTEGPSPDARSFGCVCCAPFDTCAPNAEPVSPLDTTFWPQFILYGSFTRPKADEAVLAMDGCEPYAASGGGTLLLERKNGAFVLKDYVSGMNPDRCEKIRRKDGRDMVLCERSDTRQTSRVTYLFAHDFNHPFGQKTTELYVWFTDASLTACYGEVGFPVSVQTLERKEWRDLDGDGHNDLVVLFSTLEAKATKAYMDRCAGVLKAEEDERLAERRGEKEPKMQKRSPAPLDVLPKPRKERLELLFDGETFKPTPATEKRMKKLWPPDKP